MAIWLALFLGIIGFQVVWLDAVPPIVLGGASSEARSVIWTFSGAEFPVFY